MKILYEGKKKWKKKKEEKKEEMVRFKCSCGCILEASDSEVIPVPRFDERHHLLGIDYCIRCPRCEEVVHSIE